MVLPVVPLVGITLANGLNAEPIFEVGGRMGSGRYLVRFGQLHTPTNLYVHFRLVRLI